MYTEEEKRIANNTSRNSPAIGQRAVVPRIIEDMFSPEDKLSFLDFGAGKDAAHTLSLREKGYMVTAYEFGANVVDGLHQKFALQRKYDVIFASNVLNVQSNQAMLLLTLQSIAGAMDVETVFIANYPNSPRKVNLTVAEMEEQLRRIFKVERIKNKNIIFKLKLK